MKLCSKCGHAFVSHAREEEALLLNIEKYNETVSAIECEVWVDGHYCGCTYGVGSTHD